MFTLKSLSTLVGVLALAVLVWFAGPYIAIADRKILADEWPRLLVIALLLLAWALNLLRLWWQAKQGNRQLAHGLTQQPEGTGADYGENEVAILS